MVMYITPFDIPTFTLFEMDPFLQQKSKATVTELSPTAYAHQAYENHTVLQVDLPGVEKSHVSVEVKDRKLTVIGRRRRLATDSGKDEKQTKGDAEDNTTSVVYKRTFTLSRNIDVAAVSVQSFENGVLSLVLPKKKQPEPRKIAIE